MPSFATPAELASHLHTAVDTASAQQALDGASALLRPKIRATFPTDPSPVPLDLRTWTLELAAMTYENPSGREMEQAGDAITRWRSRREILDEASSEYGTSSAPLGAFPDPAPWPA